jgi:hypothetical protein
MTAMSQYNKTMMKASSMQQFEIGGYDVHYSKPGQRRQSESSFVSLRRATRSVGFGDQA